MDTSFFSILKPRLFAFFTSLFILLVLGQGCSSTTSAPEREPSEEIEQEEVEEQPKEISEDEAIKVIIDVLEKRGLILPSEQKPTPKAPSKNSNPLAYEDYITTDVDEDGERRVHLDIGPDGHIIPTSSWRENNPNYCEDDNRFLKSADKRLQFKMFTLEDGYDVFIQYIDIETSKIEHQQEGQAASLDEAVNSGWDKLDVEVKAPTNPCGRLKNMRLYFNSRIEDVREGIITIEHLEAEVSLTATEKGLYEGGSPSQISFLELFRSDRGHCTFPEAYFSVTELYYDDSGNEPADDMYLKISPEFHLNTSSCPDNDLAYVPIWPFDFLYLHMGEWNYQGNPMWDDIAITGFTAVEDEEGVLARKVYDRTETISTEDGGTTVSEHTVFEIRP